MTAAQSIVDELKTAFPAIRARRFIPVVNSEQGCEPYAIAAAFADKDDWTKLDAAWLDRVPDGMGSALSFLSDEAVCFYIPAFISADLEGRLGRVDPSFHLTHGFDDFSRDQRISGRKSETWESYAKRRWQRLNQPQALAITHYLEWRIAERGLDFEFSTAEALGTYWYRRAR